MPIEIHISAESGAEAINELRTLAEALNPLDVVSKSGQPAAGYTTPSYGDGHQQEQPKRKRKRGRPSKAEQQAKAEAEKAEENFMQGAEAAEAALAAEQNAEATEAAAEDRPSWPETEEDAAGESDAEEQPDDPNVSADDVREALSSLVSEKGIAEAQKLLAQFGAAKFSELKEEHYESFVKAAGQAAA